MPRNPWLLFIFGILFGLYVLPRIRSMARI